MDVFAYPMRVRTDGSIAKVENMSEPQIAQELAMLVLTEPGERGLVPEWGLDSVDETNGLEEIELEVKVEMFDIPAEIVSVERFHDGSDVDRITIEFDQVTSEYPDFDPTDTNEELFVEPYESVELS